MRLLIEFLTYLHFKICFSWKNCIIFSSHSSLQTFPETFSPNHPTFLLTLKLSNFLYYCYIYSCVYRNMSFCVCVHKYINTIYYIFMFVSVFVHKYINKIYCYMFICVYTQRYKYNLFPHLYERTTLYNRKW